MLSATKLYRVRPADIALVEIKLRQSYSIRMCHSNHVQESPMVRTLVVMQPTMLPWAGYFNLIARASDFVFLDDVQLEKQSWQTRNRLLINGRAHWVSLPIRNVSLAQSIADTEVLASTQWKGKLSKSFLHAYGRHPYYSDAVEVLSCLLNRDCTQLAELNEEVIRLVAARLGLSPAFHRASALPVGGLRSDRLLALCGHFAADEYLSPLGAAEYLAQDGFVGRTQTKLRFQEFSASEYPQCGQKEFVPSLSIVDVLANLGWEGTYNYVCQGI
jgi:hypothetical protein